MAFINLLSGVAYPRRTRNPYPTITLMEYINKHDKNNPCLARKFCYIIKCGDIQKIFSNAGVSLSAINPHNTNSFWNRRHPKQGKEYGVEICEDDSGDPKICKNPVYLVYDRHWFRGNAEAQHIIYSGEITPTQADSLDKELRKCDVP